MDNLDNLLKSPLLKVVIAVVILGAVAKGIARMFAKPNKDPMRIQIRCTACGWTGQVGKYNRRCSKCNSTNLREQV